MTRSTRCPSAGSTWNSASTRWQRNKEDIERLGIEIGDIIAIDPQPEFLDNGFIVSRHLDNKAGVAVSAGGA